MALVVEDGTGLAAAESYASVAAADAYWSGRIHTPISSTWLIATTAQKESALREATSWLEAEFGQRWIGRRESAEQALSWPRTSSIADEDGTYPALADAEGFTLDPIPGELSAATISLAGSALQGSSGASPGSLLADASSAAGIKRQKVGDVEVEWADGSGSLSALRRNVAASVARLLDSEAGSPSWRWL